MYDMIKVILIYMTKSTAWNCPRKQLWWSYLMVVSNNKFTTISVHYSMMPFNAIILGIGYWELFTLWLVYVLLLCSSALTLTILLVSHVTSASVIPVSIFRFWLDNFWFWDSNILIFFVKGPKYNFQAQCGIKSVLQVYFGFYIV